MENEMLERVEQLEEKVKRLEGELARTMKARKISTVRMFGEGHVKLCEMLGACHIVVYGRDIMFLYGASHH